MKEPGKFITITVILTMAALGAAAQTVGYFASPNGPYGAVANNAGLNIGHTFTVTGTNIQISALGVYDYGSDGLNSAHKVTLFSNQTALASVTVPAGTSALLLKSFRFTPLTAPVTLTPGNYAVVAYQMNGTTGNSDGYADFGNPNNNGFNGSFSVKDGITIFEFTSSTTAYPGTGGNSLGTSAANLAGASFIYTDSSPTTIAYTVDPLGAQFGGAGNNAGLNIGHNFTVSGDGIKVFRLGVFDYQGNGLNASHTVTLFNRVGGISTPVPGGSVTVPSGTAASMANGFRFASLAAPVTLAAGDYSIIAYGMNGNSTSDGYAEGNVSGFNASPYVTDSGYSPYEFTTSASPAFPSGGANVNFACASFDYSSVNTNASLVAAYTASVAGPYGYNGTNTGLNIGHTFSVTGTNVQINQLGVYDYAGDGLASSHTVRLFVNVSGTYQPITGGSVVVPAGTNTLLLSGHRFQPLASPVTLPPGNYGIIAYQMNGGSNSDAYSDAVGGNNTVNGGFYVSDTGGIYDFTSNTGAVFPGTTSSENFGCASFIYTLASTSSIPVNSPILTPLYSFVNVGQTATLTASAFGTPPINYQWYYASTPIPNATNATLVLTNIQALHMLGNQGNYSVSAENALGGPLMSDSPAQISVTVIPPVPQLKIMPLGDSITYGSGFVGGYRAPLYVLLANANYNVNFVGTQNNNATSWMPQKNHEGHSGYRIDQINSGFLTWVNSVPSPDIILLLIGTNDYGQNYDTANATNRLDQLITLIATNKPNAKLLVANLTLRTDNASMESAIEASFNPAVPGIVANHAALGQQVYFVDMHAALGASDLGDKLHPNGAGYNKMAATWFQAITNLLPPVGSTNAVLNVTDTSIGLTYGAVPGYQYVTQRSTNLTVGNWESISTNTVPASGLLQVTNGSIGWDATWPNSAFYRLILQ